MFLYYIILLRKISIKCIIIQNYNKYIYIFLLQKMRI